MKLTFARLRCVDCRRATLFAIWPWTGRLLVTTHGFCPDCLEALEPLEPTVSFDASSIASPDRRTWTSV